MKKITFLSALFFSLSAISQITYTSSDFAEAGEEFTVSTANASFANFAATGANYNWNFGSLTASSQATTGWQNPNNSGYKLSWCLSHFYIFTCNAQFNSNFKLASPVMDDIEIGDYTISNIVEHTDVDEAGVINRMRGMTAEIAGIPLPLTIDYDDPDEIYNFPMNYGDTHTNTGHFVIDMSNMGMDFGYELSTTRTNTVQGWGSLTTPMGTFPEVIKLKSVTQRTDAITVSGIEIPIPTTMVSYQWFSKDYGIPVLQADGIELFNIFIPTSVKYLDQQLCLTADAAFAYLPTADYNPDTQSATVAFNNLSQNYTSVSWDFGDSGTSTETTPAHNYNCPGTYNVTLTVTNSVCSPSTTDTITLPVTITDSQNALTHAVTFDGTTISAVRSVPGTTYQWVDCDNGNMPIDGATGQDFTPLASGNYACMMSTNGCDALSPCTTVVICVAADADANFEFLPTVDYDPATQSASLTLTNLSTNYTSVSWDFGDGQSSAETTPAHSYACPGTYEVTLTVTNDTCTPGTTDTFTLPVVVTDSQNALTSGVTADGQTLTADRNVPGTTYQWIDCDNGNAAIDGETNQAFVPNVSGNYACMLSTNGCDAISACISMTVLGNGQFNSDAFQIYPNPTTGQLYMSTALSNVKEVSIYNALGMLVSRKLDLSGHASGMYIVKITADEGSFVRKVMKE